MPGSEPVFERSLEPTHASITRVRDDFEPWLRARVADDDTVGELLVVFSELTSNAAEATRPAGRIRFCARAEGADLVLEAENGVERSRPDDVNRWDLADPLRGGGRGLLIVGAYIDAVEVEGPTASAGLLVRCRRRLGG